MQHRLQSDICFSILSLVLHLDNLVVLYMDICRKLHLLDQKLFNC